MGWQTIVRDGAHAGQLQCLAYRYGRALEDGTEQKIAPRRNDRILFGPHGILVRGREAKSLSWIDFWVIATVVGFKCGAIFSGGTGGVVEVWLPAHVTFQVTVP